jgi:hypothetical protein
VHPSLGAATAKLEADLKASHKETAKVRAEMLEVKRQLQVA